METKPAPKTADFNEWFKSALADPKRKSGLKTNWIELVKSELPVSADQKEHLSDIPAADAKALQEAIGLVVDKGGSIHIERVNEKSPGTLIVQPAAAAAPLSAAVAAGGGVSSGGSVNPAFSVGIFHCTFDANCRNWHCGWGPAKK